MNDKIWTIGRILKWTEQYFKDKGIELPRLDAEVLLAHVLEKQRIYLYAVSYTHLTLPTTCQV